MAWLSGWDKRIEFTIDKDVVDTANQTNFPVMVYLSAASGIGDVDVSAVFDELTADANRKKIAVTSSDGTTELYVEIERFDFANEKAWLHVKVPSVAYDADTILYLYYDKDHADNDTYVGDTTDAVSHNVWDEYFKGVWHMAQDPNGDVADAIKDSTSNGEDGTPEGTMLTADLVSAKVGNGIAFDGSDDAIGLDDDHCGVAAGTVEAIGYLDDLAAAYRLYGEGNAGDAGVGALGFDNSAAQDRWQFALNDGSWNSAYSSDGVTATTWYHVCGTWGTSMALYVNGAPDGTAVLTGGNVAATTSFIGQHSPSSGEHFKGKIDEVRISNIARSAPWIKATYHSLWDSLITFGAEETNVNTTTATLTITAYKASVNTILVEATTASLTITPNAATLNIPCSVASLTITPNDATISWDLDISADLAELTIATHDATIWEGATWAAWIAANGDKVVIKYYFTLTGDGETPVVDDVEIPIPSFQCRRRSGSPTYLSVVIRGTDYADEVNARSNGDLKVEMAYELYGSEIYRETVAIVDLEDIQVDEGSSSASIVLTGHRTIAYTPKQITLRDIVYYQLKDGKYRFRCSIPNLYLAPGDTAIGDGNEFTVDEIQYIVSPELQMMEVKET